MTVVVVGGKAVDRQGLAEALGKALLGGAKLEVEVTTPERSGEGIARSAAEAGAERVVAVGGDGTVHEVVVGLLAAASGRPVFGVVPAGTANDFASLLGPLSDPIGVWVDRALTAPGGVIDVGTANGVPFANMVTIGPGAQVSDETPAGLKKALGKVAYVASAVASAGSIEPVDVVVTGPDGFTFEGPAAAVCVANGRQVGGGLQVNADGDLTDGALDVLIVPAMSLPELGLVAGSALLGQLKGMEGLIRARVAWVEIHAAKPFACSLDGDVGSVDRVRCEVVRRAIALAGYTQEG